MSHFKGRKELETWRTDARLLGHKRKSKRAGHIRHRTTATCPIHSCELVS